MRRPLALLPVVALVLSLAPTGVAVVTATAARAAGAATFTDIGSEDTDGGVVGVDNAGDVLTSNGAWHNGTFNPIGPNTDSSTFTLTDLGPDGTAVGYGFPNAPYQSGHSGFWKLTAGTSPTYWPRLAQESRGTCGYGEDLAETVSSAGIVSGTSNFNERNPDSYGCDEGADLYGFTAPEDGSSLTPISQSSGVTSIAPGWAVSDDTSGNQQLINLGSGATTSLAAMINIRGPHVVSASGVVVGTSGTTAPYQAYYTVRGETPVPLALPADQIAGRPSGARAINDKGQIVGYYTSSQTGSTALYWPSATDDPIKVDDSPNLPAGWSIDELSALSQNGLVAGDAFAPDGTIHDILMTVGPGNDLAATVRLTGADGQPFTGAASAIGQTVTATVTLAASSGAGGPITGVAADPPLAVQPSADLTLVSGPTPAPPKDGYTLQPGGSTTYSETFTIASATGTATLAVTAAGMEGVYQQTATAQAVAHLGQPLQVAINLSQIAGDLANSPLGTNAIRLDDDDNGEVPQAVTAEVTVTNVSNVAPNVTLADTPDLSVADPASNHIPFPASVSRPVGDQANMGTLAPGASAKATMLLQVIGNNVVHISQLVLSGDADTGNPEKSVGAADLTVLPTALVLVAMKPDASIPSHIITGRLLQYNGTVTNLSNTQAVDLDPVLADIEGNGGGQTVADASTLTADGYQAPVTGKLKPGDKATFHVLVQTIANAGTRTTISFAPTGKVAQADGTQTALTAKQIRVTTEASPKIVSLDDSADKPIESPGALAASYVFTASALSNLRDWAADGVHSVKDIGNLGVGTIGDGVVAAGGLLVKNAQAELELASLVKAELALHVYFSFLTPQQKQDFADQIALDAASADTAWTQFHSSIDAGVANYLSSFANAFEAGDSLGAAKILGAKIGYGLPEVLSNLMPDLILNKVARGLGWGAKVAGAIGDSSVAKLISLGGKIKESKIVLGAAKALEGVTAGDNLLASSAKVLKNQFGLAQRDIDIFKNLASREKLLIAVRQRNPISTAWLKTKRFLVKPELIKIKNVDQIDVDFLGYLGKGGPLKVGDLGTVVLKEPDSLHTVTRRLVGQTAEVREAALARYKTRVAEWDKYEKLYKEYDAKGVVDIGFDKAAQGAGTKGRDLRKFNLEKVRGEGSQYYRVQVSDARGTLKGITGDIDIVAILNADGSLLNAAARAKLYDALLKAVGMQHGESFSFILNGEFLSTTKTKLLADHLPGRELLAVFGSDGGARAAYFDPKLTVFNSATKEAVATFVGAYSSPVTKAARFVSINLGLVR